MGAEAGSPAEHLNNMLKAYIMKDVKENLKDHITVVPLEDRFCILTSLIDGHKRTVLHHAAIRGHTDIIDGIFDTATENQKSELSLRRDKYGNTATALAAFHGHTETIQYMLNILPADRRYEMFKETSNGGQSSLHIAASKGHTDVIKTIFESATKEQKTELSVRRDMYGNTATALAAFHGHVDTVRYILNILQPATIYEMLNEMSNGGKSILHIAAREGQTDVIKTIFEAVTEEQKFELSMHQDIDGSTATALAAFNGHADTVRSMLDILHPDSRYEMLKKKNKRGQSILHIAASKGQTDVIKTIIESAAEEQKLELSVYQNIYGNTAIAVAALYGHTEAVRYMLNVLHPDMRCEVLKKENNLELTSLHMAASKGKADVIEAIVESVTEEQMYDLLMLKDSNGHTAIISAAFDGHANTARHLLHAVNSDTRYEMLKVTNTKRCTALHIAASEGHTNFLQTITGLLSIEQCTHLLLQPKDNGDIAIALASIRGHTTAVELILNCIDDLDKKYEMLKVTNMQGQTAVHSAALKGHTDVVMAILRSVTNKQVHDLMLQLDCEGYTAIELIKRGGHAEKSVNLLEMIVRRISGDFESSDTLEMDIDAPSHSRHWKEGIRKSEEYLHGREAGCLNCSELEEEVQQLKLHQNLLNTQQNERELLIEDQAAKIKQLTNQVAEQSEQIIQLTNQTDKQKQQIAALTNETEDQHRKLSEYKESIEDIESKYAVQSAALAEKDQPLEAQALQMKQLTNQLAEKSEQLGCLRNLTQSSGEQVTLLTNHDAEEATQLANMNAVQTRLKTEAMEEWGPLPGLTADQAGGTKKSSSDEESSGDELDYDEFAIPVALKALLGGLCTEYGVEKFLFHQNPEDHQEILIVGKNATKLTKGVLEELKKGHDEWSSYTVSSQELDEKDQTRQFMHSKIEGFKRAPLKGFCELIAEAKPSANADRIDTFVVGPAHMMFDEQTNEELRRGVGLKKARDQIEMEPSHTGYWIKFRAAGGDERTMTASHPPMIGYRYKINHPNAEECLDNNAPNMPGATNFTNLLAAANSTNSDQEAETRNPVDSPEALDCNLCLNDMVLLPIKHAEAEQMHRELKRHRVNRTEKLIEINTRNLLRKYIRFNPNKKIAIKVKDREGILLRNTLDIGDQIASGEAFYLRFKLNEGFAPLDYGDSGSVVWRVMRGGNLKPLGMLIGTPDGPFRQDQYQAAILSTALKDIETFYHRRVDEILLFNTTLAERQEDGKIILKSTVRPPPQ